MLRQLLASERDGARRNRPVSAIAPQVPLAPEFGYFLSCPGERRFKSLGQAIRLGLEPCAERRNEGAKAKKALIRLIGRAP